MINHYGDEVLQVYDGLTGGVHRCAAGGDRHARRAAADHRVRRVGQDPGHLAADRGDPVLPGVEPRNIIAFTFTEKAAAELKERHRLWSRRSFGDMTGLAEMYIGTMHGYALDLLQTLCAGDLQVLVLTDIQTRLLIDRNSRRAGSLCPTLSSTGTPRSCSGSSNSKLYMQVISVLREDDVDEELLPASCLKRCSDYRKLLHDKTYFDFTEMINLAVELLEGDADDDMAGRAVRHIRDDIRYVVVDEYQDVNPLQERLVERLCQFGANLCVVGDDDQTIYQWRGSEVSNIVTFAERYDGVRQVTLDDNFRSSEGIVELGRSVAELIPTGQRLPKSDGRGRASDVRARRPARADLRLADRRGSVDLRPHRGAARPAVPRRAGGGAARAVVVGLRGAVPVGRQGRRAACRRAAAARHPVRGQGTEPAVRQPRDPGRRRHLPATWCARSTRTTCVDAWLDATLGLTRRGDWAAALPVLDEGRDWRRGRAVGRLQHPAPLPGVPRGARAARGDRAGGRAVATAASWSSTSSASSARRSRTSSRSTSRPTRRQKYEAFANWLEYQAPDYYAEPTPTSATRRPTR